MIPAAYAGRDAAILTFGRIGARLSTIAKIDLRQSRERAYGETPYNGLGLSIVALVRGGVLYEQAIFDKAMQFAEKAEVGFTHSADEKRQMDAVSSAGSFCSRRGTLVPRSRCSSGSSTRERTPTTRA
ncbi:MAG TPA: hypothetical protein VE974_22690 [Thermoanaerobaculia bacterium]|nr:hypothetical protein [Thermoanaerobaculia bacterium]